VRIPEKIGRFYGNVWPFYMGSAGLLGEFLRKRLAVRRESTEKFGQAALMAFPHIAGNLANPLGKLHLSLSFAQSYFPLSACLLARIGVFFVGECWAAQAEEPVPFHHILEMMINAPKLPHHLARTVVDFCGFLYAGT
jgi:hypothetical protein